MSLPGFLLLLLVAAVSGSLGMLLAGYSRGGCLASILFGFIGAYVGWWIAQQFRLPAFFVLNIDGEPFPIVWAVIGAALVAAAVGLLFRSRRSGYRRTY